MDCACYPCVICGGHHYTCRESLGDLRPTVYEWPTDWGDGPVHDSCRVLAWSPLEALWRRSDGAA